MPLTHPLRGRRPGGVPGPRARRAHVDRERRLVQPPRRPPADLRRGVRAPPRPGARAHRAARRVVALPGERARHGAPGQHRATAAPLARQVPRPPSASTCTATSTSGPASSRGARRTGRCATATPIGSCGAPTTRTWSPPCRPVTTAYSRLSLRFSLSGSRTSPTSGPWSASTAAKVYGLDLPALREVAAAIEAPTYEAISQPLEAVPAGASPFAFRTAGPWA